MLLSPTLSPLGLLPLGSQAQRVLAKNSGGNGELLLKTFVPNACLPSRDEEELRKSLSELADPNPKSIKRISSCSNPFLDFSQDPSIATYKHGLLVRKSHAEPDCKKSKWGCSSGGMWGLVAEITS